MGNPRLRRVLYLAAVAAVKTDSPIRDFYQRLLAKGKPKKVALIAVARKLLTLAFTLVKTQCPYDHEFRSTSLQP
jgi:transposase